MPHAPKPFKPPSKRHQPRGLSVLYEDRDILVVDKACGLLTVGNDKVRENTAYFLLTSYVRKGNPKSRNRIFIVHRLDRDTSGVIVFAKSEQVKRHLQDTWPSCRKIYHAIIQGTLPKPEGVLTSYLTENRAHKMYSVRDADKGKLAKTGYRVLKTSRHYSLLEIDLLTGRKNQIRVHMAEAGCPVAGDKKYGEKKPGIKRLALHAASITIVHPHSGKTMTFTAPPPPHFESPMGL